jgi:predicted alpha-1,2-mannosidase
LALLYDRFMQFSSFSLVVRAALVFGLSSALFLPVRSVGQSPKAAKSSSGLTRYVDPFIGTGFHGHVFMGANVPFGAVQLGPTQMSQGWDWCSGYHYSDSLIVGFAHTHLNGTGIGDLGDVLLMPATGPVKLTRGTIKDSRSGYASRFSHTDETARPGYYRVKLQRYNIDVALTATERVGLHQYTFPKSSDAHIVLDLGEGVGDKTIETYLEKLNDTTLVGYRFSKGWAPDQRLYFAIVFAKPLKQVSLYDDQTPVSGASSVKGIRVKGVVHFATQANEKVLVKVGISPVSTENALGNIRAELPHWNFSQVVAAADRVWNQELGKVVVKTNDQNRLKIFYTSLFHTLVAPSLFNDHNGDYRGTDKKVYTKAPFANLTTFSLWDTYRAANPLFTITQPRRVSDMVNSMLAIFDQQGKLPVWHLVGNETNTMPGNSAMPVIADACLKGIAGIDVSRAFEAMKKSAMLDERGLKFVKAKSYIPADSLVESVARGLEYAIDDWAIAQVAKKLNKQEDYAYFSKRAKAYQQYFDPEIRFMRGRVSDSERRTPFSPLVSRHMKDDFAEGNAWQYTWLVPQDVEGLVTLFKGEDNFTRKLDSLFVIKGDMGAEASSDITGLIGQYAHGNEPSHHITYLYAYVGQPWKTANKVRYILDSLYTTRPDGLSGNEDVGQMSAWYVLSSLGFYPVNPANGAYVFGSPVFDEATLNLENGKVFRMKILDNSSTNRYIKRITLNGKPYTQSFLMHKTILDGGELVIEMAAQPGTNWGVRSVDRPRSVY